MLLHSLQRRALCRITTGSTQSLRSPSIRLIPSLQRSQWRPQTTGRIVHGTRNASTEAAAARKKVVINEMINVYRAGTAATLSVGLFRLVTIVLIPLGSLGFAPAYFLSDEYSSWWAPVVVVVSALPFLAMALATGPMVHAITVRLPMKARRSREDLIYFSKYPPADTPVDIQFMRWIPWPMTVTYRFDRLRRLEPSLRAGISNLEVVHADEEKAKKHPWSAWVAAALRGRYYVNRVQKKDRAAVPGVWDNMWKQIPLKGQPGDPASGPRVDVRGALRGRGSTRADARRTAK